MSRKIPRNQSAVRGSSLRKDEVRQNRSRGAKRVLDRQVSRPVEKDKPAFKTLIGSATRESLVMGRNCIEELLRHDPGRLQEVFVVESASDNRIGQRKDAFLDAFAKSGIPVRHVERKELDALVLSESHQGIVAKVAPREPITLSAFTAKSKSESHSCVLALDGVLDPHNLGAILRSAECFGVSAVVWSRSRTAPLGPVVSKVSVGGSELLTLLPVGNLHRALEELKQQGFWVVGAATGEGGTSLSSFSFPEKTVLVMGSEGDGLHQLIEKCLDFRVFIPMVGRISSLNVAQATTVMLAEIAKQQATANGSRGQNASLKVT